MGSRCRLLRLAEMPVVRPGVVATHAERPGGGQDQAAQNQGPELVLRPQSRDGILGFGQACLPPHGPDQYLIWIARSTGDVAGRGAGALLGAASASSSRAALGNRGHGTLLSRQGVRAPAAAERDRGAD